MFVILSRHHPRYFNWEGIGRSGPRSLNTSFAGDLTPNDVVNLIDEVVRRGGRTTTPSGDFRVVHEIDGVSYDVIANVRTGRIEHFSPLEIQ